MSGLPKSVDKLKKLVGSSHPNNFITGDRGISVGDDNIVEITVLNLNGDYSGTSWALEDRKKIASFPHIVRVGLHALKKSISEALPHTVTVKISEYSLSPTADIVLLLLGNGPGPYRFRLKYEKLSDTSEAVLTAYSKLGAKFLLGYNPVDTSSVSTYNVKTSHDSYLCGVAGTSNNKFRYQLDSPPGRDSKILAALKRVVEHGVGSYTDTDTKGASLMKDIQVTDSVVVEPDPLVKQSAFEKYYNKVLNKIK